MINSLFPSVFPTTTPATPLNEQTPAVDGTGTRAAVSLRQTTTTTQSQESERAHHHHHHHHHNKLRESDGSNLYRTATHMIRDAFQSFRQDLRDSFQSLGFDGGMASKITKGVMHATRDALRTGVDFSAKLTFAAITQVGASAATEATDAADTTQATDATDATNAVATTDATNTRAVAQSPLFSIVARSIEVNINHKTGTVDVKAASVSIEGQPGAVSGDDQPHLLDISDSDQGLSSALKNVLLALQDLTGLFSGDAGDVEEPTNGTVDPAALAAAGDIVDDQAGAPAETTTLAETSTERAAVEPTLASVTTEETTAPATDTEEAEAAPETPAEETQEAAPSDPGLPQIKTPLLLNDPNYTARIFITAFQQTVNDRQETLTFMRFDAIIPLSSGSTSSTDETEPQTTDIETPVVEAPVVETPVVETPVVETPVVEPTLDQTVTTVV